jgi:pimeloyl-ACP methyl ester carboxylesterase
MQLRVRTWGKSHRVAVLIHGLSSNATSWRGVGASLAQRGYRVVAPDLRGHGSSPRGYYSVEEWTDDILETVPPAPDLAIGHSLGGVLLLKAAQRLRPARAVYVDPPWAIGPDPEQRIAEFQSRKRLTWRPLRGRIRAGLRMRSPTAMRDSSNGTRRRPEASYQAEPTTLRQGRHFSRRWSSWPTERRS